MSGEGYVRRAAADAGIEIIDVGGAGFAECHAMDIEAGVFQSRLKHAQRAGIGGVLEPLQANPVVIEDNAFIGARSEVAEGVIVGTGAVLSMGVFIGASTKIVDRATGQVHIGKVPPYAVVVPGSLPGRPLPDGTPSPSLYCAVIVKTVDAQTRSKTGINELLRD
jgi:2,3,4,5-tetrahydropyridine-2-carboxylate N-succinyltransferase